MLIRWLHLWTSLASCYGGTPPLVPHWQLKLLMTPVQLKVLVHGQIQILEWGAVALRLGCKELAREALEGQSLSVYGVCVRFLHFIKVLTNHKRTLTRYI